MTLNSVIQYFDLAAATRPKNALGVSTGGVRPASWVPQYASLLVGIAVQPLFESYRLTGVWDTARFPNWFLFSMIVALLVFPAVYKNAYDPLKPVFVQLCSIFASGIGWQALMQTAIKLRQ
jgi:hypothetical protein